MVYADRLDEEVGLQIQQIGLSHVIEAMVPQQPS